MQIPKSLKLNQFQLTHILSNREIFSRFGRFTPGVQAYTGDDALRLNLSKTDGLAETDRELSHQVATIQKSQQRQEEKKEE